MGMMKKPPRLDQRDLAGKYRILDASFETGKNVDARQARSKDQRQPPAEECYAIAMARWRSEERSCRMCKSKKSS